MHASTRVRGVLWEGGSPDDAISYHCSSRKAPPWNAPPWKVPPWKAPPWKSPTVESPTVESPTMESPTMESPTMESPTMESPGPYTPSYVVDLWGGGANFSFGERRELSRGGTLLLPRDLVGETVV
ncbi:hypothetical protein Bbelb_198700 [Branchiostoma belcheri]|nr:hypothetical protein Bbelb_198700 [Branchiostoma belcheri]